MKTQFKLLDQVDRVVHEGEVWGAPDVIFFGVRAFYSPAPSRGLVPRSAVRADRRSVLETYGLPLREALRREWVNGVEAHFKEGAAGAARFASGLGRHGDFETI